MEPRLRFEDGFETGTSNQKYKYLVIREVTQSKPGSQERQSYSVTKIVL